ncbi:hypothetical protein [Micromonospora sp. LOL_024]|uniref:hypothetical protein n=1 Tax=Micromonospora sp. LOL_024 TaxID=3345412 RepID=UPI003A8A4FF1
MPANAVYSVSAICASEITAGALAQLGHPPVAVLTGAHGRPIWPDGVVVGGMTHCAGYRAASLAPARARRDRGGRRAARPAAEGMLGAVSLPPERDHLAALTAGSPRTA